MALAFEPVVIPGDSDSLVAFLTGNEWPYHGVPKPTLDEAESVRVVADDIISFWIHDEDEIVGLIRLLDVDDVDNGSPMFDVRIGTPHRGRGIGRIAVQWLTGYLFRSYPGLHRIEATTRSDNLSMQAVFAQSGYRQEGRFVEAWKSADGTRSDTLVYAILRREFTPPR
ncbi:MAG: hypothetical protein JWN62_1343 [Acidimicrobiales bacterium]|nr:hypothetical protein [Acidimicrobiales bacterium]